MNKPYRRSWWLLSATLLFLPSQVLGLTVEEVMDRVVDNIKGPAGMTVVAEGAMRFSRRNLQVRTARYCSNGTEGFQMDVLSPMEDQEVPGATPQTNKKYRVVRAGMGISTLTYLPSLRRGRKINYVPLDGILGSDYPYYLLPSASNLLYDFSYTHVKNDPETPIIEGVQKEGSRSPYSRVELHLRRRGDTYTIEQAVYDAPYNQGFTLTLQDFEEFAKGYWAPREVVVKETTFTFNHWQVWEPLQWLHSTNHGQFDAQSIPSPNEKGAHRN